MGVQEKKQVPKVDFSTLDLKLGDTLLEVGSGCIAKIVEIDTYKGIGFQIVNRPRPEEILFDSQKEVEHRLKEGYLTKQEQL